MALVDAVPEAEANAQPCRAVVFLGPPGAGKGTQSKLVAERLGLPHLSTGDMLREHIASGDALGSQAKAIVAAGDLVPDELVNEMVAERLAQPDYERGVVLDGYPRTVAQAAALGRMLTACGAAGPVVINFQVDYNELIQRLTGRRSCPHCGRIYNVYLNPPANDGVCDGDGSRLVQRSDDQEEVIRERLFAYDSQTRPLVDFYQASGFFFEIDGNQPVDAVTAQLLGILKSVSMVGAGK
jgi:adenylate kinase